MINRPTENVAMSHLIAKEKRNKAKVIAAVKVAQQTLTKCGFKIFGKVNIEDIATRRFYIMSIDK